MTQFPPKPAAPNVRQTIGTGIARSRDLSGDDRPMTRQEILLELLSKLDLPEALQRRLRERHDIDKAR